MSGLSDKSLEGHEKYQYHRGIRSLSIIVGAALGTCIKVGLAGALGPVFAVGAIAATGVGLVHTHAMDKIKEGKGDPDPNASAGVLTIEVNKKVGQQVMKDFGQPSEVNQRRPPAPEPRRSSSQRSLSDILAGARKATLERSPEDQNVLIVCITDSFDNVRKLNMHDKEENIARLKKMLREANAPLTELKVGTDMVTIERSRKGVPQGPAEVIVGATRTLREFSAVGTDAIRPGMPLDIERLAAEERIIFNKVATGGTDFCRISVMGEDGQERSIGYTDVGTYRRAVEALMDYPVEVERRLNGEHLSLTSGRDHVAPDHERRYG